MAQPIRWSGIVVPNGGIDERFSAQKIPDNKWTAAKDVEPTTKGVRRRPGSSKSNTVAVTSGTDPISFTGIVFFEKSDASLTRHLLTGSDGKLYKNTGGTALSAVSTDVLFATSSDAHTSWAIGQDRVFITDDGTNLSRRFWVNGTADTVNNEGISPPTDAITATAAANTNSTLASGDYYVDYIFWDNDLGQPSNAKYDFVAASSVTVNLAASSASEIQISGLATAVARSGDRATHVRIYIQLPGSSIFRFAGASEGQITLGTATATITADNTTTEAETEHDVPPKHGIKVTAENRQFIADIDGQPSWVQYSLVSGTSPFYESFPPLNFRRFGVNEGDRVTALAFMPPRTLIVGMQDSLYAIDARQPGTSDRIKIASGIGIAGKNACKVIGRRLYFVSDGHDHKGMFVWPGAGEPAQVPGIHATFKGLSATRVPYASCAHLDPGDERHQWWTLIPISATGSRILVYDYMLDAWTVYHRHGNIIGEVESNNQTSVMLGGRDGFEYQHDSGTDDAGTSYTAWVTFGAEDFGDANAMKRLRGVRYVAQRKASNAAMSLNIEVDYGDRPAVTGTLTYPSFGNAFVWGTSVWGAGAVWGGANKDTNRRLKLHGGAGRVFQPTYSGDNDWYLKALAYGVQLLGRE